MCRHLTCDFGDQGLTWPICLWWECHILVLFSCWSTLCGSSLKFLHIFVHAGFEGFTHFSCHACTYLAVNQRSVLCLAPGGFQTTKLKVLCSVHVSDTMDWIYGFMFVRQALQFPRPFFHFFFPSCFPSWIYSVPAKLNHSIFLHRTQCRAFPMRFLLPLLYKFHESFNSSIAIFTMPWEVYESI